MGIGLSDDHVELATTVRRWVTARDLTHIARLLVNLGACDLGPRVFVFPV